MSRKPRVHFPEAVYHVICPGAGEENPNNQRHLGTLPFSRTEPGQMPPDCGKRFLV